VSIVSILDVLAGVAKTGRLGPVFIGARWQDVTAAAGEPWDIGATSRQRKWPRLFAYGDLELSVCECRKVTLICIQTWRDVVELPASIVGGTGAFAAAISYSDVVSALERSGCDWQPYPALTFEGQCSIVAVPSAMTFTFEIDDGGEPVLNIAGLPGDGHACAELSAG